MPVCSEGRDAESVVNRMAISSAKKRSPVPELERTSLPPSPCSHVCSSRKPTLTSSPQRDRCNCRLSPMNLPRPSCSLSPLMRPLINWARCPGSRELVTRPVMLLPLTSVRRRLPPVAGHQERCAGRWCRGSAAPSESARGGSLVAAASTSELRGQGVNVRGGDEAMPGGGGADSFGAARVAAPRQ